MQDFILVMDESGAKGRSLKNEKYPGEFGVIAGYVYPLDDMEKIQLCATQIVNLLFPNATDKIHITDLSANQQKFLRGHFFHMAKMMKIEWFYKAIYCEGFHQAEHEEERNWREPNGLLHAELFQGVLTQGICLIGKLTPHSCRLMIKTDHVDKGVLKKFKHKAEEVLDTLLDRETKQTFTNYDKETEQLNRLEITMKTTKGIDIGVSELEYEITCEHSPLTLFADVLANSTYYYLNEYQKENIGSPLNTKVAISRHPLSDHVLVPGVNDESCILDHVFRRES